MQTAYYRAKVPIWIDEIPDVEAWKSEFLKPEAKEVVEAVGAWVYCFRRPKNGSIDGAIEQTMKAIQEVSQQHAGYGADVGTLAVALPAGKALADSADTKHEDWEDICLQYGFEYIDYAAHGTNDFGERVGFERLKEALEANEWAAGSSASDDELNIEDLDFDAEDDIHSFAQDEVEMTAELFGMRAALANDDRASGDDDFEPPNQQAGPVEGLDRLVGKLLAVKEQSVDLPEAQRKRMAAKAVRELMGDSEKG